MGCVGGLFSGEGEPRAARGFAREDFRFLTAFDTIGGVENGKMETVMTTLGTCEFMALGDVKSVMMHTSFRNPYLFDS